MQSLDVVNMMLGTQGENPLASLEDTHPMLATCLEVLDRNMRRIEADGWWYNMEELSLIPNPADSSIYLPNDTLEVRTGKYNVIARGNRVYNLTGGTYVFTVPKLDVILIRLVAFEDLPEIAAQYIGTCAVVEYQMEYDGDSTKTRQLMAMMTKQEIDMNSAHTRNRKVNLIVSNARLQRLKFFTRAARMGIAGQGVPTQDF